MKRVEKYLTIAQFAGKLGVSVPTVRCYIKAGKIEPTLVCNSHLYFSEESVARYSGIFTGKKRMKSDRIESFAVLYIANSKEEVTPSEQIALEMQKRGFSSLEEYDNEQDIQSDELADFDKYCKDKSFYSVLGNKVGNAKKAEKERVSSEIRNKILKETEGIYTSSKYMEYKKVLESGGIADEQEKKLRSDLDKLEEVIKQASLEGLEEEKRCMQEIDKMYSSEFVDESGDILADAPENCGIKYARLFKSVRQQYVKNYRLMKYSTVKRYVSFTVVADDLSTYELPFLNIINKAYDKVFMINKDKLSSDWQNVFSILCNQGVVDVEDIILE